ncbi:MAG: precorrin-8X methylmutase [Candidatus Desantisbacteria bacterium]
MEAIILLGHGSRLTEANKTLKQMAEMVKELGNIPMVEIGFLQFVKPDFFDAISACISKGAKKIIIHPYFLYRGRHFEEDIAEMIGEAQRKYPDVEFILTEPLGVHENLAKVVLERAMKNIKPVKIYKPHEIEIRSFEIITEDLGETNFRNIELPIVKRVIHATGDFEFAGNMRFHPEAVEAGIRAIKSGMNILVDVEMVKAGINKGLLEKYGGRVICRLSEPEVKEESRASEKTRCEIAIELGSRENIGIVAIGNAPTALYKAMKLIGTDFKPELVIGVPVGFVKAVESKEVLLHMKYPFITSLGRKGGSSVAVAIVNALLKMTEEA